MFKGVFCAGIFLFCLCVINTSAAADVLDRLTEVETYKWYPAQAKDIYQQINEQYGGSEYALAAHKNLVLS